MLYTGWTFFALICCKNCIVCLKRPKINEKEAGVGPFKKNKPKGTLKERKRGPTENSCLAQQTNHGSIQQDKKLDCQIDSTRKQSIFKGVQQLWEKTRVQEFVGLNPRTGNYAVDFSYLFVEKMF